MNQKDIIDAPTKIMLFSWLNNLLQNKNATFNKENPNIIELDSFASSWFCIGRDNETLESFLGIPHIMIPWFAGLPFEHSVISFKNRRLYLSLGDPSKPGLTISIKIREKRMKLLWNEKNNDEEVTNLKFLSFLLKADNEIVLDEQVFQTVPLIKSDLLSDVVYCEKENNDDDELISNYRNSVVGQNHFYTEGD